MVVPRFLLDTNAISEPVRPRPSDVFLSRFRQHQSSLCTCAIVWHEAWYGVSVLPVGARRRLIEEFLQVVLRGMPILPYDDRAARWHGEERARLRHLGRPTSFADGQIAAVAVVNDRTLVTSNTADFTSFAGLKVVDWTLP